MTNAHRTVAKLCSQMANTVYDELAMDNTWYKQNPNRQIFVRTHLDQYGMEYVIEARRILGSMCADPKMSIDEKDRIVEALAQDAALRGSYDNRVTLH